MNIEDISPQPTTSSHLQDSAAEGHTVTVYEVDLSEGWDTKSQLDILEAELHKLAVYRPGLLYSGFNADDIGKRFSSAEKNIVWAMPEEHLFAEDAEGTQRNINNPFMFADTYRKPALAIYDPEKLQPAEHVNSYEVLEGQMPLAVIVLRY